MSVSEIVQVCERIEYRRDMYKIEIPEGRILAMGNKGTYVYSNSEIIFAPTFGPSKTIAKMSDNIILAASAGAVLYTVDLKGVVCIDGKILGTIPNFITDIITKNKMNGGYKIICNEYNISVVGDEVGYTMKLCSPPVQFAVDSGDIFVYIYADLCVFNTLTNTVRCDRCTCPCDLPKDAINIMFPGAYYTDPELGIWGKFLLRVYILAPDGITTIILQPNKTKVEAIHSIADVVDVALSANPNEFIVLTRNGLIGAFTPETAIRPLAVIPGTYFHPIMNEAAGSMLKCDTDRIKIHAFSPGQIYGINYLSKIALPYNLFVDSVEENNDTLDVCKCCDELQDKPQEDIGTSSDNPDNPDTVCNELQQFSSITVGEVSYKGANQQGNINCD